MARAVVHRAGDTHLARATVLAVDERNLEERRRWPADEPLGGRTLLRRHRRGDRAQGLRNRKVDQRGGDRRSRDRGRALGDAAEEAGADSGDPDAGECRRGHRHCGVESNRNPHGVEAGNDGAEEPVWARQHPTGDHDVRTERHRVRDDGGRRECREPYPERRRSQASAPERKRQERDREGRRRAGVEERRRARGQQLGAGGGDRTLAPDDQVGNRRDGGDGGRAEDGCGERQDAAAVAAGSADQRHHAHREERGIPEVVRVERLHQQHDRQEDGGEPVAPIDDPPREERQQGQQEVPLDVEAGEVADAERAERERRAGDQCGPQAPRPRPHEPSGEREGQCERQDQRRLMRRDRIGSDERHRKVQRHRAEQVL